jgi:2-dehydro-3-deoxyphosphogluconate aldolase/(4S)-4-hydroxy-2-oxoglutarate aldolase
MTRKTIPEFLLLSPVIPVVTLEDSGVACDLAHSLVRGGVRVLEVALRHQEGLKAISAIAREVPEMRVGAGTVVTTADLRAAADAGASFAVSPGVHRDLLEFGSSLEIPYMPGIATATELMSALREGYVNLKFFPALAAGGTDFLRAMAGPFSQVRFLPTGGITSKNAADFLELSNVLCVGGSWPVPSAAIAQRDWDCVETLAAECMRLRPDHLQVDPAT